VEPEEMSEESTTWLGWCPCDGCGTTLFGDRHEDEGDTLCSACLLLRHSEPYCDKCAYNPGWGVLDGEVFCEGCYAEREREIELERIASHELRADLEGAWQSYRR
jgi:hypothetical protein